MRKKKILIVSRSFYPEKSPRSLRTTELVKEFARQGHHITLLTIKKTDLHAQFEDEYGVTIKDLGTPWFPEINLEGSSGVGRLFKRALRRILLLLFEYPDIELMYYVQKALKKESGYDLLISIATPYPVHWGVAMARSEEHAIADVWVADCGDPYYGLENDTFHKLFYFAWVEKWFCRRADYITIPLESAINSYFDEFHDKIKIIPQGLSFPDRKKVSTTVQNGIISFAYFGNIQSYLHYAIPFLEKLNTVGQPFRFIVYTRNKELFKEHLDPQTLSKCVLRDYVDRDVLLNKLGLVDFLVYFPYRKGSQKSLKLIDYAFLEKPILEYKGDELSNKVLEEFLEYNFVNRKKVDDYRKYEIENICTQFIKLTTEEMTLVEAS